MSDRTHTTRSAPIPIPSGGLRSNEDEARWLEQTIVMRTQEMLAANGITTPIAPQGLYDLLFIALESATRRGRREGSST